MASAKPCSGLYPEYSDTGGAGCYYQLNVAFIHKDTFKKTSL